MWSIKHIICNSNVYMFISEKINNTIFIIFFCLLLFSLMDSSNLYQFCLGNSNLTLTKTLIHICNIDTIIYSLLSFLFFILLLAIFLFMMSLNLLLSFEIDRKLNVLFETIQYFPNVFVWVFSNGQMP